jgi:hypothetical protein
MGQMIFKTVFISLLLFTSAFPYSAKKLYFTPNGVSGGASIEPGFGFNAIWTSLGMGKNKCVYVVVCDQLESQPSYYGSTPKKGNCCLAEYNPYTNTMKSCGTVKKACTAIGNWMSNESQDKIHTHLQSMADGKIWMATHENEGSDMPGGTDYYVGIFYRGSHMMYVDVNNGDTLVDYSPQLKYYYKRNDVIPTLMTKGIPPSDTSGMAIQWQSVIAMGINPWSSRYIYGMTSPGVNNSPRIIVWDLQTDSTRTVGSGDGNQRELLMDRQGNGWWVYGGSAVKKTPWGVGKAEGSGLVMGSCMTYSRSFDSAFTITSGTGEVSLYDFLNDTVKQIGKMPNGGNGTSYRALVISTDGKKLYTLNGGRVYEFTIATGASVSLYDASSVTSGYSYQMGNMCVDTLGNLYAGLFNSTAGAACLLQVNLGTSLIRPLDIPTLAEVEKNAAMNMMTGNLRLIAAPNPFNATARITAKCVKAKGPLSLKVFDSNGRLAADLSESVRAGGADNGVFTASWDASQLPAGVYFAALSSGRENTVRKLTLLR